MRGRYASMPVVVAMPTANPRKWLQERAELEPREEVQGLGRAKGSTPAVLGIYLEISSLKPKTPSTG